jgi:hypothetical protein
MSEYQILFTFPATSDENVEDCAEALLYTVEDTHPELAGVTGAHLDRHTFDVMVAADGESPEDALSTVVRPVAESLTATGLRPRQATEVEIKKYDEASEKMLAAA